MSTAGSLQKGITGRQVFFGFVAFFGVMFLANGVLLYYAISTFSGGDRPDPYRSGLNYNQTIAEAERQAALGWSTQLDYDAGTRRLTLRFSSEENLPVSGLKHIATLKRPAENRSDRDLEFREWSEGVYVSEATIDPGYWVFYVVSSKRDGGPPVYRLKQRLLVADRS